jgi:hypothetical protein
MLSRLSGSVGKLVKSGKGKIAYVSHEEENVYGDEEMCS